MERRELPIRKWLPLFGIIAIVLLLDQITKRWVLDNLAPTQSYNLIPALYPYFQLTLSENRGAAFGFLPQAGDLFLILALVVVVIMLVFYPRIPEKARVTRFALGLVVGGALGNAFDRVTQGVVIDFIHYSIPNLVSNVSNLADHAIVIGVILIVLESWRAPEEPQPESSEKQS
jgi:signal peptidase II